MKPGLYAVILAATVFGVGNCWATAPVSTGLFRAAVSDPSIRPADKALPGQTRVVRVNRGQLRSGRLHLNLGLVPVMTAERERLVEHGDGSLTWVGRIAGDAQSTVTFAAGAESVAGTVRTGGRLFKLLPAGKGRHVLSEVPPGDPYPELGPIPVGDTAVSSPTPPADALAVADDGSSVDVLALYTPASVNRYGGVDGIEALIQLAITETNQAYLNSGVVTRLRLAHTAMVDYTESGSMQTDLDRLRSVSDGYMDEAHALRDQFAADLVTLIEESPDYCGIAYLMTGLSTDFEDNAFSVVYSSCATGYYSFGHELGHNMGCDHDHDNAGGAVFPYSHGWQDPLEAFRTIMAYNCTGNCPKIQHFSNPAVSYSGLPTGVADYADNARSLNDTAYTVANWRSSTPLLPPEAPTDLSAVAGGVDHIALAWTDNATVEDGFRLERSEAGGPFMEIAQLPANTTAYTDTGLKSATSYGYRLYAYNSAGVSPDSNIASATTDVPPASLDQSANGEILGAGAVSGDYTATWEADGNAQIIEETHSGGKPSKRHALLEHTWTFSVQPASAVTLLAQVETDATDGEAFSFAFSTDGESYADMFTVTATSSAGQQLALPAGISGTLYVRVRDTQRTPGSVSHYRIGVDRLLIRSETGNGEPPIAPSDATAQALTSSAISVNWTDSSDDEYGFELERTSDGGVNWDLAASLPANATEFTDTGLAPNTTYGYRVLAFNGSGRSAYSNETGATTLPGAAIQLSAAAGKVRGEVYVDLSWSGAGGATVDLYRDGAVIAPAEANDGAYRDLPGRTKGSLVYQVCETGTARCSDPVSVTP